MTVRIIINSDWDDILNELDRLEGMPDAAMHGRLDSVLRAAYFSTQAEVHVITGSLRGSGNAFSEEDNGSWEGTISYGGPSPGFPFNPVRYAHYERRRGGHHDFMAPVFEYHEVFVEAMRQGLQGDH